MVVGEGGRVVHSHCETHQFEFEEQVWTDIVEKVGFGPSANDVSVVIALALAITVSIVWHLVDRFPC